MLVQFVAVWFERTSDQVKQSEFREDRNLQFSLWTEYGRTNGILTLLEVEFRIKFLEIISLALMEVRFDRYFLIQSLK